MKTTTATKIAPSYTILETKLVCDPKSDAELFGSFLAADRGYSSRIVRINAITYDLVASDNRAIRFVNQEGRVLRRVK